MTKEEAIEVMKTYRDMLINSASNQLDGDIEAFDMAIKALEQTDCGKCKYLVYDEIFDEETGDEYDASYCGKQESCEDCMHREFVEILVNNPPADLCAYPEYKGKPYYSILYRDEDGRNHVGFGTYKIEILSQWINEYFIAGIQPKLKTGHWLYSGENGVDRWTCDNCFDFVEKPTKICPNCGAKMENEE